MQGALQREKNTHTKKPAQSLPFSSTVSAKKMQRRKGPQLSSTMQCHSRFLAPWTLFQPWPICWMCLSPETVTLVSLYCPDKNVAHFSSASCSLLVMSNTAWTFQNKTNITLLTVVGLSSVWRVRQYQPVALRHVIFCCTRQWPVALNDDLLHSTVTCSTQWWPVPLKSALFLSTETCSSQWCRLHLSGWN